MRIDVIDKLMILALSPSDAAGRECVAERTAETENTTLHSDTSSSADRRSPD
jgi:hypothetical protein